MYSYIKGTVEAVLEDRIVLDNNGIGYEIFLPLKDLDRLGDRGAEKKIYTFFQVSENGVALYGFLSTEEKRTFELLIGVNGVGPKAALSILGTISADDLRFAILSDDVKAITAAPGIGPKSAKRIILDLKDKLNIEEEVSVKLDSGESNGPSTGVKSDAVAALVALGYNGSDAIHAINRIDGDVEALSVEETLKLALKELI